MISFWFRKYVFGWRAKADNIEKAVLRQTFNEENQGIFCLFYPFSAHRPTSIQHENIFSLGTINFYLDLLIFHWCFECVINIQAAEFWDEWKDSGWSYICTTKDRTGELEIFSGVAKSEIFVWNAEIGQGKFYWGFWCILSYGLQVMGLRIMENDFSGSF